MANQKSVTPANKTTEKKSPVKKSAEKTEKKVTEKKPVVRNHDIFKTFTTGRPPAKTSVLFAHAPGEKELAHGKYSAKIWLHVVTGKPISQIWSSFFEVEQINGKWTTTKTLYNSPEEYQVAMHTYCQEKGITPAKDGDFI